jgi:hypothetical protein
MKNVMWKKQFKVAISGRRNWNKGINDIYFTMMSDGVYCACVLYFDELTKKPEEAFFHLKTFTDSDADQVWSKMDSWVTNFTTGMGGFQYIEK